MGGADTFAVHAKVTMAEGRDEASVTITEDGCDDFVLIELVDENTTGQSKTSNSRSNTTSGSGNNSRTEYEDFVELSIEDIEVTLYESYSVILYMCYIVRWP